MIFIRKKATFKDRECLECKEQFTPNGPSQRYCKKCSAEREKQRKYDWYDKKYPDRKKRSAYKPIEERQCCICGSEYGISRFDGKTYCNKHYLRMKNNGTPELKPRVSKNTYEINGDITTLYTTKGEPFYIDTINLEKVLRYTWCKNKGGYLVANNGKVIRLHRYILDLKENDNIVDHINHKPEDNTIANLRICTQNENGKNLSVKKNNSSGHPGVRITPNNKYQARIWVNGKEKNIGRYDTFEEAVDARIQAELEYFKEFSPSFKSEKEDE